MSEQGHLRWERYSMFSGEEHVSFWNALRSKERRILYVLGSGFDPRMLSGLESLISAAGPATIECRLVRFGNPSTGSTSGLGNLAALNNQRLAQLGIPVVDIELVLRSDGRRVTAQSAASAFSTLHELNGFTDVVVDISAMPRGVYFPLLGKLCFLFDQAKQQANSTPNLFVVVTENTGLDSAIQDEGIDEDASFVFGFSAQLETEANSSVPKLWVPILGENQRTQLQRIHEHLDPDEIAPVLPNPSSQLRRSDRLLMEYHELFFDEWRVEPGNFIYASETNPFEVYRQIRRAALRYRKSLSPLGGCRAVVSALSSKLLSIGGLLSAVDTLTGEADEAIAMAHVEALDYAYEAPQHPPADAPGTIYTLWLMGSCYEEA